MIARDSYVKDTPGGAANVNASAAPSLDGTTKTLREHWRREWLRKRRQSRFYQRVRSGLHLGGLMKFVTLTTSTESWAAGKDIQRSFRALVMRLRRRGWCSGYVKVTEFTEAGLPHLHVLIRGPYIPQSWLSEAWSEIHSSPVVDIRLVRGQHAAAGYLAKYLGKRMESRYSWSWDWVWRGFAREWSVLVREGYRRSVSMVDIIRVWETILFRYKLNPWPVGRSPIRVSFDISYGVGNWR